MYLPQLAWFWLILLKLLVTYGVKVSVGNSEKLVTSVAVLSHLLHSMVIYSNARFTISYFYLVTASY